MSENDFIYNDFKQGLHLRFFDAKKAAKKAGDRQFLRLKILLAKTDVTLWGPASRPKLAILFSFQNGKRENKQKRNPCQHTTTLP